MRVRRWLIFGALFVLAVNLIALALGSAAPTPGGPTSSSYATGPDGLAAYAELLARTGRTVTQSRQSPAEADLDPGSTVVVLDPEELTPEDHAALSRFVSSGGRLIAGGSPAGWTEALLDEAAWSAAPVPSAGVLAPAPETARVSRVTTGGIGSFSATGSALPLIGRDGSVVAAVAVSGEGTLVLVADATPLQNRYLDEGDNAAFALGLAGPEPRPVVFLESVHGYGSATGLGALPSQWKWALALGCVAAALFMWSRARRIGPPDEPARDLPPPRVAYVDSLAGILARTNGADALLRNRRRTTP